LEARVERFGHAVEDRGIGRDERGDLGAGQLDPVIVKLLDGFSGIGLEEPPELLVRRELSDDQFDVLL